MTTLYQQFYVKSSIEKPYFQMVNLERSGVVNLERSGVVNLLRSQVVSLKRSGVVNLTVPSNSDILTPDFDTLNGVIYKLITATEEAQFSFSLNCNNFTESRNCKWSDNAYGSVNCNGGKCRILQTQNPDYTISACIGCYINDQIDHAGACRPTN